MCKLSNYCSQKWVYVTRGIPPSLMALVSMLRVLHALSGSSARLIIPNVFGSGTLSSFYPHSHNDLLTRARSQSSNLLSWIHVQLDISGLDLSGRQLAMAITFGNWRPLFSKWSPGWRLCFRSSYWQKNEKAVKYI